MDVRTTRLVGLIWTASALVYALGLLHLGLFLLFGVAPDGAIRALDLDGEGSLPAWYASILYFCSGAVILLIGLLDDGRQRARLFWLCLGALMAYMSLDEAAQLHEQSGYLAADLGVPGDLFFHHYQRWLTFGVPAAALVGLFFLPMLLRIDRRTAVRFCAAGALVVLGAIGLEALGGLVAERVGEGATWHVVIRIEEGLELVGLTLILTAAIEHLARHHRVVELRFREGGPPFADHRAAGADGGPAVGLRR